MFVDQQFSRGAMRGKAFTGFGDCNPSNLADETTSNSDLSVRVTSLAIDAFKERLQFAFVRANNADVGGGAV